MTTPTPPRAAARRGRPAQALAAIALAGAAALLGGCVSISSARMALPAPLSDAATERFDGLGGDRQGRFTVGEARVRYERTADRWSVFDRVGGDNLAVRMELALADGTTLNARCDGRRRTVGAGIIEATVRPLGVDCRFDGALPARLDLRETRPDRTMQAVREGTFQAAAVQLQLQSVHQLQGSPLPLAEPAGYVMRRDGREVAAVELAAGVPVLRRAEGLDAETRRAALLAAVALGLIWDPAALR